MQAEHRDNDWSENVNGAGQAGFWQKELNPAVE